MLNSIIHANCFTEFKKIPDESIDAIITDPPYGINYKSWDKFENFEEFSNSWLEECKRVLKPDGNLWSFMAFRQSLSFIPLLQKHFYFHYVKIAQDRLSQLLF